MIKRVLVLYLFILLFAQSFANGSTNNSATYYGDTSNAGLKLPKGFVAIKAAENIGRARHIAVSATGGVYVKSSKAFNGKSIYYLEDNGDNGKLTTAATFDKYAGTGIYVKNGYLYTSSDEEIFRYKLDAKGTVINSEAPERIVTGLINRHQHESK